ncbi:MAG: hypothetical protein V4505_23910 [Pseudomonadota bacterium]
MSLRDEDGAQHLVLAVVAALVLLVVAGVLALAVQRSYVAAEAAPAQPRAQPWVAIEDGIVRFRFVPGRADLPTDDTAALADLVKEVMPGRHVVVAPFFGPADGVALAQRRAVKIRDALKGLGLLEDKVELRQPAAAPGPADTTRVDVMLVD